MTDEPEIDDIDIDNEDLDSGRPTRTSLKDTWNNNPLLKVGTVVVVLGILLVSYFSFSGPPDEAKPVAVMTQGAGSTVRVAVGQEEVDEEYGKAMEKENKERAEQALNSGISAMPTPIGTSKSEGVAVPQAAAPLSQEDPLKEWRARTEAKRVLQETAPVAQQEEEVMRPDVVPMVQPVRPQAVVKMDPNAAAALAGQMRMILATQAPEGMLGATITAQPSPFDKKKAEDAKAAADLAAGVKPGAAGPVNPLTGAPAPDPAKVKIIIQAGSISYAQLLNDLNSDIQGPVLAQMLSGPLQGGRALGSYSMADEYLILKFSRIVKDGVTYNVDGIAMDEKTTLTAQASDVDHHYFKRVILPAAASFVSGYGSAVAETGTSTTTTSGGGVATETPEPDATEELSRGLQQAADTVGSIINQNANKPITVKLNRGSTMGILFMNPVTTASAN